MVNTHWLLLVFFITLQQLRISISQSSVCTVKQTSPEFPFLSLHEPASLSTCSASGLATDRGWLKKETRKEYYLTTEEFKSAIENDEVYVIDVREPYEVENGRVPAKRYVNISLGFIFTALRMSDDEFEQHFEVVKFQKHDKIVTMCKLALQAAQDYGYENTKHYLGGWLEWESTFPLLKI